MAVEYRGSIYRDDTRLPEWLARRPAEDALDPDLPIIDPHQHLWDSSRWGTYMFNQYLSDVNAGHNIIASVYVEAGAMHRLTGPDHLRPVGEVEFARGMSAMSASGQYGKTQIAAGIVGYADLTLGDAVEEVLLAEIDAGGGRLKGIRYSVPWDEEEEICSYLAHYVPPHQLLDDKFREGFARLAPLGLSYDVWMLHPQLPDLIDLARAFPDTQIILDHLGSVLGVGRFAGQREETFTEWRNYIIELAACENVAVKIGGLGMTQCGFDFHLAEVPATSEQLAAAWRPYVDTCIETFGVNRCMFESNFPPDRQSSGFNELWNAFKRITSAATEAEKVALFCQTAADIYKIKV